MATLMLENGADIRVIQEMFGHAKLTMTELYCGYRSTCCARFTLRRNPATHLKRPQTPATTARDAEAEAELFDILAAESEENGEEEDTL